MQTFPSGHEVGTWDVILSYIDPLELGFGAYSMLYVEEDPVS